MLTNVVFLPATGQRFNTLKVEGTGIADLRLLEAPPLSHQPEVVTVHQPVDDLTTPTQPKVLTFPAPKPFHDPAIVSYGQAPPAPHPIPPISAPVEAPSKPAKQTVVATKQTKKASVSIAGGQPEVPSAAILSAPFSGLGIGNNADGGEKDDLVGEDGVRRASITKTRSGKPMDDQADQANNQKAKKKRGKARRKDGIADEFFVQGADVLESSPEAVRKPGTAIRGKGWRQTPILQDQPTFSPGPPESRGETPAVGPSKRKTRKQRQMAQAKNGWATEDATDVLELPEFDFEGNLSKFDKRSVFDQIRNEDTTADEDRLVSINRLPRPGTFGGQKLHPSENVLEKTRRSETSSSSDDDITMGSGRTSRRAMSRASVKRRAFGSTSAIPDDQQNTSSNPPASNLLKQSQGVS